jgi:hypothetical protein
MELSALDYTKKIVTLTIPSTKWISKEIHGLIVEEEILEDEYGNGFQIEVEFLENSQGDNQIVRNQGWS